MRFFIPSILLLLVFSGAPVVAVDYFFGTALAAWNRPSSDGGTYHRDPAGSGGFSGGGCASTGGSYSSSRNYSPGESHPRYPHVVMGANGKWSPEDGYEWVSDDADDYRVRRVFKSGDRHPSMPHIFSVGGNVWRPDSGYDWINPGNTNGDLRVRWVPGSRGRNNPHVIATNQEGRWEPEDGYAWVGTPPADWGVRWQPGKLSEKHPHLIAGASPGDWTPEGSYTWVNPGDARDFRVKPKETYVASPTPSPTPSRQPFLFGEAERGRQYQTARELLANGDAKGARAAYREADRQVPADYLLNVTFAMIFREAGQWHDAAGAYRRGLQLSVGKPNDEIAICNMFYGLSLEKIGDASGALSAYHEALRLAGTDAKTLNTMGSALRNLGAPSSAEMFLARAQTVGNAESRRLAAISTDTTGPSVKAKETHVASQTPSPSPSRQSFLSEGATRLVNNLNTISKNLRLPKGPPTDRKLASLNCQAFFRALGEELAKTGHGWRDSFANMNADQIVAEIDRVSHSSGKWRKIQGNSQEVIWLEAQKLANQGLIVVGGSRAASDGHGHLGIVFPTTVDPVQFAGRGPFVRDGNEHESQDDKKYLSTWGAVKASKAFELSRTQWYVWDGE